MHVSNDLSTRKTKANTPTVRPLRVFIVEDSEVIRERLKARLLGSEADCDRLRHELEGLRREVASLVAELQHHRNEQAATAEAFAAVLGQLSDLQKPLTEVHRRLQTVHSPVINGAYSHA